MLPRISTIVFLTLIVGLKAAWADLVFSAPPRETAQAGHELYGPLARFLSDVLGQTVRYEHPDSWKAYATHIQNDDYDIVFDGPHFAAWRIAHADHAPIVRLPENLRFYVVTNLPKTQISSLDSLKSEPVCAMPAPNLTALVLGAELQPDALPEYVSVKGGNGKLYKALMEEKCKATVLRDQFADAVLDYSKRSALRVIFRTRDYPNQTITAGPKVPAELRQKLVEALTGDLGSQAAARLLKRFAPPGARFIPANPNEFTGDDQLLQGNGW